MIEVLTREPCWECSGKCANGFAEMKCEACKSTGWIERWEDFRELLKRSIG